MSSVECFLWDVKSCLQPVLIGVDVTGATNRDPTGTALDVSILVPTRMCDLA
jgi:hypothetical protein